MKNALIPACALACLFATAASASDDPVQVDPKHYQAEFENDAVRVLRIKYGPGEKSVMHNHPAGVVIYLTDSSTKMTFPDGKTIASNGKAGTVQAAPGGAHLPENVGGKPMELVLVELKGGSNAAELAKMQADSLTWFEHHANCNADGMANLYAEDALLLPPGAPVVKGRAGIKAFLGAEATATKAAGITLKNVAVTGAGVSGDTGWISGSYAVVDATGATLDSGSYLSVHRRINGQWLYIRDTWNSDRPAPPAAK